MVPGTRVFVFLFGYRRPQLLRPHPRRDPLSLSLRPLRPPVQKETRRLGGQCITQSPVLRCQSRRDWQTLIRYQRRRDAASTASVYWRWDLSRLQQVCSRGGALRQRWRVSTHSPADLVSRRADVVTMWVRRGAEIRLTDERFRERSEALYPALALTANEQQKD